MSTYYPEATILGTHVREFRSSAVGQDYEISVLLPHSYATSQARYPVLYLLDGNIMMACVGSLVPLLLMQKEIPEIIVVGIGNHLQTVDDWNTHRCRDYTPIADDTLPGSGGGEPFYRFVRDELIPFIDAEYRTDPDDRTLFGYSLSGMYAVYALLQQPGLFKRYIAGSPAVGLDKRVAFDCESEYARDHTALPAKVFMEVGSLEQDWWPEYYQAIHTFIDTLRNRNYADLDLTFVELEGETHVTGLPRTFNVAMKTLYR
jgi:uncharacterized protein